MTVRKCKKAEATAQGSSSCRNGDDTSPCCVILQSMTDGIFTVDLNRRINIFYNRTTEEITGFRFAEAAGQFCFDILHFSI